MTQIAPITFATRFRGFLPVVIDVETGGFNSQTDALLEIAAVFLEMRSDGTLTRGETVRYHVVPFPGANMEAASLAVNGIDPHHPLRPAIPEEDALQRIFREVRNAIRAADCTRAVLVGHNAFFDLNFLNAAVARAQVKRNPFHPFTSFDTATLGGVAFGQTVLMRRTHGRSLLHGVQSVSGGVRRQPPALGLDGTVGDRALDSRRALCLRRALGRYGARFRQQLLELAALVHLDRNVAAAHQFAVDIELRKSRPIGIGLQCFAHFRVLEYVYMCKLRLTGSKRSHRLRRESALRKIGCALHVQDHRRGG